MKPLISLSAAVLSAEAGVALAASAAGWWNTDGSMIKAGRRMYRDLLLTAQFLLDHPDFCRQDESRRVMLSRLQTCRPVGFKFLKTELLHKQQKGLPRAPAGRQPQVRLLHCNGRFCPWCAGRAAIRHHTQVTLGLTRLPVAMRPPASYFVRRTLVLPGCQPAALPSTLRKYPLAAEVRKLGALGALSHWYLRLHAGGVRPELRQLLLFSREDQAPFSIPGNYEPVPEADPAALGAAVGWTCRYPVSWLKPATFPQIADLLVAIQGSRLTEVSGGFRRGAAVTKHTGDTV